MRLQVLVVAKVLRGVTGQHGAKKWRVVAKNTAEVRREAVMRTSEAKLACWSRTICEVASMRKATTHVVAAKFVDFEEFVAL
jgi:hypothetical protein